MVKSNESLGPSQKLVSVRMIPPPATKKPPPPPPQHCQHDD